MIFLTTRQNIFSSFVTIRDFDEGGFPKFNRSNLLNTYFDGEVANAWKERYPNITNTEITEMGGTRL